VISFESIQIECCILFLFSFELNIFSIRMHIQIEVLKKKFHLKFHCLTWIDSSGILIHVWLLDAKKYRRLQISLEKLIFKMAEFPIHTFESLWMPSRKDIYIVLLSIFFFFFFIFILFRNLSNNRIHHLDKGCLYNLTALVDLKLARNRISSLPKELFKRLSALKFL
jgi:hypothetical protein